MWRSSRSPINCSGSQTRKLILEGSMCYGNCDGKTTTVSINGKSQNLINVPVENVSLKMGFECCYLFYQPVSRYG